MISDRHNSPSNLLRTGSHFVQERIAQVPVHVVIVRVTVSSGCGARAQAPRQMEKKNRKKKHSRDFGQRLSLAPSKSRREFFFFSCVLTQAFEAPRDRPRRLDLTNKESPPRSPKRKMKKKRKEKKNPSVSNRFGRAITLSERNEMGNAHVERHVPRHKLRKRRSFVCRPLCFWSLRV